MKTTEELLDHLSKIMQKLDMKRISTEEAKAQASLVKQSNNLLRYELDCRKFAYKLKTEATQDLKEVAKETEAQQAA